MGNKKRIIIAGFGGQGVIFAGQMLAIAAMKQDYCATVLPSYGPEMRGGTANCTVVISPEEIYSPVVDSPNILMALNQPSLERYETDVEEGGIILLNSSLAHSNNKRSDVSYYEVKASDIATGLGDIRVANVVAVGALNSAIELLEPESLRTALKEVLSGKNPKLIELNLKAMEEGAAVGATLLQRHKSSAEV